MSARRDASGRECRSATAVSGRTIEVRTAALGYAGHGWPVLPLHNALLDGGCSCGAPDCATLGKHPLTSHGPNDATTKLAKINESWDRWPSANIGTRTGTPSGVFVLDVDSGKAASSLPESGPLASKDAHRERDLDTWR